MKKFFLLFIAATLPLACAKQEILSVDTPQQPRGDAWTIVPDVGVPAPDGPSRTVVAGFSDTKVLLRMDAAGTHAVRIWEPGDKYRVIGRNGNQYTWLDYTTAGGGSPATFTGGTFSEQYSASGFWMVAPSSSFYAAGNYGSKYAMLVTLPSAQTAYAGKPDPAALISASYVAAQTDKPTFHNFVSLVKFRLSGGVLPKLTGIKFTGANATSGGVSFYMDDEGKPSYIKNVTWSSEHVSSRSVTLTPPAGEHFVADTDYYIAIVPDAHDSFTMVFTGEEGGEEKTITKISKNSITRFNRSRIADFGTIDLGDTFDAPGTVATPYMQASAGAPKPVSIVVVSEGYQESELDKYEMDAKSGIEALFKTEPYKTYKDYFNVWILKVASAESGANVTDGNGNITEPHNCYFGTKWGPTYSDMRANDAKVFAFVEDNCPDIVDGTHTIDEVPILLVVNDTRYGGINWVYSSGRAYCIVPTTSGNRSWAYPSNEAASVTASVGDSRAVTAAEKAELGYSSGTWRNILVHEFGGHGFGRLSDEYFYDNSMNTTPPSTMSGHGWNPPFGRNVSTAYDPVQWDVLLENQAALVSTNSKYSRIGKYQGGDVYMFGRWRSERISCMIDNRFYFSTWQRWLIANRIMELSGREALSLEAFLANDVPDDPVRDVASAPVMQAEGVSSIVPPRPSPMLPPPVLVNN